MNIKTLNAFLDVWGWLSENYFSLTQTIEMVQNTGSIVNETAISSCYPEDKSNFTSRINVHKKTAKRSKYNI